MRLITLALIVIALVGSAGCGPTNSVESNEQARDLEAITALREENVAAIRAIDSKMVAALNARDLDTWIGFLAQEARMMPPNAPILEGKPAIRELVEGLLSLPDFSVTHHPADKIVVSQSGDLAYVSYAYELTIPSPQGPSITDKGKDISIFQKQSDGSWKLVVDMWSQNEPD